MPSPRYREDHPEIKRNDMLDIMIDCLKSEIQNGSTSAEDLHEDDQFERDSKLTASEISSNNGRKKDFDELLIVATALVVTIAGTCEANITFIGIGSKAIPRFGEFCSCYCLSLPLGLACGIHPTWAWGTF